VIATGARYRKLDVANYSRYENQGIYYAATAMEANLVRGHEIAVIGGGNSADRGYIPLVVRGLYPEPIVFSNHCFGLDGKC
jgi:alkyl hydroperoxide reductase subunit AhpF